MTKAKPNLIDTVTRSLPCKLTEKERLEFADELAGAVQQVTTARDRKKALVQQLNAEVQEKEARREKIANIVASGNEYREIDVEIHHNKKTNTVMEVRTDDGSVVTERPMTEDEKQLKLA